MSALFLSFEPVIGRGYFVYEDARTYLLLMVMGLTNTVAMMLFVYTTQFAKPTTVSLLRYVSVLYYFGADVLIFG